MKPFNILAIAIMGGISQFAIAHTELTASDPANLAMLEAAPENISLTFSEPVRLTALTVQKQGEAKRNLGPLPAAALEHFTVAAPGLGEGHYTVNWRALSEDTHVMTGEIMFMAGAMNANMDHGQHMQQGQHMLPGQHMEPGQHMAPGQHMQPGMHGTDSSVQEAPEQ
jgi:methionine-rich copper-binding protein CopC